MCGSQIIKRNCRFNKEPTLIDYLNNNKTKDAKIAGFGLESFGGAIENSYSCGELSGHWTYGFVANSENGGSVKNSTQTVTYGATFGLPENTFTSSKFFKFSFKHCLLRCFLW